MHYLIFIFLLSNFSLAENFDVIFLKGKLEILRQNKEVPPPVQTGDRVKLSPKGIVVLKSKTSVLKLTGETIIMPLEDVSKNKTIISLIKGEIISKVHKKPFEVKTRNAVLGVRGTEFYVSSLKDENTWMCVNEGMVAVTVKNKTVDVKQGLGVSIGDKSISKPKFFSWTKGISWVSSNEKGTHKIQTKYNLLDQFYD